MNTDELEFEEVYTVWQPKIQRYLVRLIGEDQAEDLTQETFVKVNRSLKGFRGDAKLSTWIYRIATNVVIDKLRSASFRGIAMKALPVDDMATEESEVVIRDVWTGEPPLSIEQHVVRNQMNDCIRDFIGQLPEGYRTVLVLREMEGLKTKEVAEILGITVGTVKIRLHRAKIKLREQLIRHCDPYWIEGNEFVPDLKSALNAYRNDT